MRHGLRLGQRPQPGPKIRHGHHLKLAPLLPADRKIPPVRRHRHARRRNSSIQPRKPRGRKHGPLPHSRPAPNSSKGLRLSLGLSRRRGRKRSPVLASLTATNTLTLKLR